MPPIYLLLKPVSGSCNMRCRYCFYHDSMRHRQAGLPNCMSAETAEQVVKTALSTAERECTFAFQGGEPTLAGIAFFQNFHELVERYNSKRLRVHWLMQTNGYAIDREWAAFLSEKNYLVGLSLDGIKDVHDLYRRDAAGAGTFAKTLHAAQLLASYRVPYNILTVVTAQLAQKINRVYGFYKRNGFRYQQYIPCLEPLGEARGARAYSLTPELYGMFLCRLFDLWYLDTQKGEPVSIRYFDNLLLLLQGRLPEGCGMLGHCTRQTVVEADGTVYPCDFYCLDQYALGNLNKNCFAELETQRKEIGFIQQSLAADPQCAECRWKSICRGGCRRDRESAEQPFLTRNYYCVSYQKFFEHAFERLHRIAEGSSISR